MLLPTEYAFSYFQRSIVVYKSFRWGLILRQQTSTRQTYLHHIFKWGQSDTLHNLKCTVSLVKWISDSMVYITLHVMGNKSSNERNAIQFLGTPNISLNAVETSWKFLTRDQSYILVLWQIQKKGESRMKSYVYFLHQIVLSFDLKIFICQVCNGVISLQVKKHVTSC